MRYKLLFVIFILFIAFYLVFTDSAYAYLDLGSGSYIFQFLIAGLFGILFAAKMFRDRIKEVFKNLFSKRENHE